MPDSQQFFGKDEKSFNEERFRAGAGPNFAQRLRLGKSSGMLAVIRSCRWEDDA